MSKPVRLWAITTAETYKRLLVAVAETVDKDGKKVRLGEFVEQAVIEKLDREQKYARPQS